MSINRTGSSTVSVTGVVLAYAGPSAPTGWLLCDGTAYNASTSSQYQPLYDVITNTYGGTNNTNFMVPDLRGRVPTGKDDMGGSAASRITAGVSGITGTTLGAVGGDQNMQQHTHTQNAHSHTGDDFIGSIPTSAARNDAWQLTVYVPGFSYTSNSTDNTTATNQNTGSGAAQNVQPAIILNYIIKI